ncbi:capsule assembly Wzi family protein [Luteirhabdus pelagi]|uniref:capsule assembly Wzi family protein n=1 Tax=Luteirhabdus pelagi TaxID=2792783 RepID=UPI00193AADF3|nr:capsule assembly Wzi family protein [Luteirhabdus pelagi]
MMGSLPRLFCFLIFTVLVYNPSSFSQSTHQFSINGFIDLQGSFANADKNPFWISANTSGALSETTTYVVTPSIRISYGLSENDSLAIGVSGYVHDGFDDQFQRKEAYLEYKNDWLRILVGSEKVEERFNGASVVAENFWMSGNSRPLAGFLVEAPKKLFVTNTLSIDYGLGHYFLNDERVVQNAWVHFKRLGLSWNFSERNTITFKVEHYAQWSGTSEEYGVQPNDFNDFWDVFLASRGSEAAPETDRANATGEHMGLFSIEYQYKPSIGIVSFYHEHPIEDGSGTRFQNFPDGIWGVAFIPNTKRYDSLLKTLVAEYIQTTNQSGQLGRSGNDNYFNGGVYQSGWSYERRIIGLPFIQIRPDGVGIQNNRLRALHLGLVLNYKRWDLLLKTTMIENLGTYTVPFNPKQRAFHNLVQIAYTTNTFGAFTISGGHDLLENVDDSLGATIGYHYSF